MTASRVRVVWNILKIALAGSLVGFVLLRMDTRQFSEVLKNVSIRWLLISLIIYLGLTLLKSLQYYTLVWGKMTYSQVLNVIILQNAVSNFLASGAGIASYLTSLHIEHDIKVSRSFTMFLLTKIGDLIALWLALLVSSLLIWTRIGGLHSLVIVLLAIIAFVILMFLLTVVFRQRFVGMITVLLNRVGISQIKLVRDGLEYLQSLSEIDPDRLANRLIRILLLSLLYFVVSVIWSYTNFIVFDLPMEIVLVIFINVLLQLISYFPIQVFGGLGVTEASSLYFWGIFGITPSVLAPVLVGIRILFYLCNLVLLIYLPARSIFSEIKAKRAG